MIVLAIDPGSLVCGYAALSGLWRADLIEAGVLTAKAKAKGKVVPFFVRVDVLACALIELIGEIQPDQVVIEAPTSGPGTGSRSGARSSLIAYGVSVGALDRAARHAMRDNPVMRLSVDTWAKGGKVGRQLAMQNLYQPAYTAKHDTKTGDVADAICIARFAIQFPELLDITADKSTDDTAAAMRSDAE